MDSLGKKHSSLGPSGSFELLVAFLVGIGGGIFGNTEGVEDNQSCSEPNMEWEGRVLVWDERELEGKMGAWGVLVEVGKSSSNVTHCWGGFPLPRGGSWRRGVSAGRREEGCVKGKAGAGHGSGARESRRDGVGLRVDEGPSREVVLWSCGEDAVAGATVRVGAGRSG